jgi:uncharacterized protein YkwD
MSGGIRTLVALVAVAIAATAGTATSPARTSALAAPTAVELDIVAQVNAVRRSHGLPALRTSRGLRAAAHAHSSAMATRGFFAHTSADGSHFSKRVARYYPRGRYGTWSVGETLLWSSPDVSPSQAIGMWMNSPAHRRIILTARWREVGLAAVHVNAGPGVFKGAPVTVVTADFGVRR